MAEPQATSPREIIIPDHELVRMIGRGSYGEVWLARSVMGTFRAVKVIRRDSFESAAPFERELVGIKKFEPISRTHEGLVDVLQIGRIENPCCLYYVMEVADDLQSGQTIDPENYIPKTLGKALARVKRFSVDECVQMGMALCQALEHLHRSGLVHRDIKPSNIIFINGAPKFADIGLVTESEHAHSFVGTEGFIPPEGPGSKQADIFSLGKALYEVASGRDRLDFPALPGELGEFADSEQFLELNEILIRACRAKPVGRYSSAREMFEDFALLASGKSLRWLRTLERRWKRTKRISVTAAAMISGAAMVVFPFVRERQFREQTQARQIGIHSASGIIKMDQGDLSGSLLDFAQIFKLEAARTKRYSANQSRIASILANAPRITQMLFLDGRVASVELDREGKHLLAVLKFHRTQVFNGKTAEPVGSPIPSGDVWQATISRDGRYIATSDEGGYSALRNIETGLERRLKHPSGVIFVAFSPDGGQLATGSTDGIVRVWNVSTGEKQLELRGHSDTVRALAFSPDGELLASAGQDKTMRLWNAKSGRPVGPAMVTPDWITSCAFSPDSRSLVTGGPDGWARVWNPTTGEELPSRMHHADNISKVEFSPDGLLIATASADSTVRLWDASTTMPLSKNHVLRHSSGVLAASFASDGHRLITGCADGSVRIWDLAIANDEPIAVDGVLSSNGKFGAVLKSGSIEIASTARSDLASTTITIEGEVCDLALSANGESLAASLLNPEKTKTRLAVWRKNEPGGLLDFTMAGRTNFSNLELSPNGTLLAFRAGEEFHVVNLDSKAEWELPADLRKNDVIAFHPFAQTIAVGNGSKFAILKDPETSGRAPIISIEGDVRQMAFTPDGKSIVIAQADTAINPKAALVYDTAAGRPIGSEIWHRDGVLSCSVRPDGLRAATAGEDRDVLVWEMKPTHDVLMSLAHSHQVLSVQYSENGRWIGSVCRDRTVRVWDGDTGFPLTPPLDCERMPTQFIFLSDGQRFASCHSSNRFLVWTYPTTTMSPEEAVGLSHILNSDLRVSGRQNTKRMAELWASLNQKYPGQFAVTDEEVARWHRRQLRLAESRKLAVGIAFHKLTPASYPVDHPTVIHTAAP